MKYVRTKDGITTSDKVTHELIEDIYCSGYLRTLKKGANVRIGEEWSNFYGRWVDIIDENGCHYSIKPSEVERVTKELPQAEDIVELCDEIVLIENGNEHNIVYLQEAYDRIDEYHNQDNYEPRLIGRIKVGLDKKAVAEWKENEQGLYDWVLL